MTSIFSNKPRTKKVPNFTQFPIEALFLKTVFTSSTKQCRSSSLQLATGTYTFPDLESNLLKYEEGWIGKELN
ncbi:unnamed protein product [Lactuca virosa]|uniref:Uncharacterized protein n=1 Tax=Lactuca virosa TaxID=75947 RepID=A0AAU9LVH3_9ASTR|nr:unnamed protein product [Lactuca virosa]